MTMAERERVCIALSEPTAELIERYADFDEEGYIAKFQIINEELIGALRQAAEWLQEGFMSNERLSEVWSRENPCEHCADREGCTITCRRKHSFDKEVYGGLLCGTLPAAHQLQWGTKSVKNDLYLRVRLESEGRLCFERSCGYLEGIVTADKKGKVRIEGKSLKLRPWSAALYTMFVLHPEGLTLASLAGEHKKEFVKIYANISQSEVKVARLREQLEDEKRLSHLLNNKLSELNTQLSSQGVGERFLVRPLQPKANNKPFSIPYLQR